MKYYYLYTVLNNDLKTTLHDQTALSKYTQIHRVRRKLMTGIGKIILTMASLNQSVHVT